MPRFAMLASMAALSTLVAANALAQGTITAATETTISPSAAILPEDTVLHVSVPDADAFCERFTSSKGAGFYTGEEMAPIREKLLAFWGQANAISQQQLGVTVDDILSNAKGELALAVTQAPGTPLSLVIVIGFEDESIVDGLIEKVESAYEAQGGEITRASVGGVEITTAAVPEGDVDSEAFSMNYFVADSKWVIGTNRAILEEVVDAWDGSASRSLATNDVYADMLEKVDLGQDRPPAIIAFFDPINLIKEVANTASVIDPNLGMQIGMGMAALPATGLEGLVGVMSATDFATVEGYDAISRQFVMTDDPTTGLLEVFAFDTGNQTPPSWVSAGVGSYSSMSWKVDGAYAAIERMVDNFMSQPGKTAEFLDQVRDLPGGPGIHIKDDVLDQLDGQIRTMSDPGDGESVESLGGSQLFALSLKRTHSMNDVLGRVVEATNGQLETREFRGTTIYEFEMPAQSPTGEFGTQVAGMAVVEENLMFATDIELLEQVIRGDTGDTLADSQLFKDAVADLPNELAAMSFTNVSETVKPLYSFVQSGALSDLIPPSGETAMLLDILDDLPPFDSIEKYFGVAVGDTRQTEDGLLSTQRYMSTD